MPRAGKTRSPVDAAGGHRYLPAAMSASHGTTTDDHETHETHPHPPMPAVQDEAADTPMWVPVSGLVLFLVMVLFVMMRASMATPPPDAAAATTDEAYPTEGVVVPVAPTQPGAQ